MGSIVLKEINITLDSASVQKAIDEINSLNDDLIKALDKYVKFLLEKGVAIARLKLGRLISNSDLNSGDLMRSIRVETEAGKIGTGYLCAGYPGDHGSDNPKYANVSYAVFVEFGTGTGSYYYKQSQGGNLMKTQASIDRNLSVGNYDASRTRGRTKNHPSGNVNYKGAEEYRVMDRYPNKGEFFGWVYKGRDGKFYVSEGQNPKPFMYSTMMFLKADAEDYGSAYIAEYIANREG